MLFNELKQNSEAASQLLKAMSNSNRLMILCALIDQELSVTQMNTLIPLSQSALSQHLASLRSAGLVTTRRESQTIYYRIEGNEAIQILTILKNKYCKQSITIT